MMRMTRSFARTFSSSKAKTGVLMLNMGGPSHPDDTEDFLKRLFLSFRKGIIVAKDERGELLSIQKRREERLQRGKEAAEAYNLQWEKDELWRKEGMANVRSMQLELLQVIRTRRRNTNALKLHTQRIQHEREMIRKAAELVVQGKVKSMEEAMAKTMNRGKSLHANRMEMLRETMRDDVNKTMRAPDVTNVALRIAREQGNTSEDNINLIIKQLEALIPSLMQSMETELTDPVTRGINTIRDKVLQRMGKKSSPAQNRSVGFGRVE